MALVGDSFKELAAIPVIFKLSNMNVWPEQLTSVIF